MPCKFYIHCEWIRPPEIKLLLSAALGRQVGMEELEEGWGSIDITNRGDFTNGEK
jgi:hypothetical protein